MTGRRFPTRLLSLALVLGVVVRPAAPADEGRPSTPERPSAPPVQVTMAPTGPSRLPHGAGLTFSAPVRNRKPASVTATITFRLNGAGGPGPYVDFDQWTFTLPPGGIATSDRRVVSAQWFTGLGPFRLDALIQG